MKTYKAPDNSLHFLDDDSFAHLLPASSIAITDAEADAIRAPTPEQVAAISAIQAKAAQDAADALAAKQDAFVATVAGFTMTQVDNFVETNFASSTAAQKNFFKALGKIAVISARKL